MRRSRRILASIIGLGMVVTGGALAAPAQADPGPATLSEHSRLADRRFVTTGDHFSEGGAAGATYPATGGHIRGGMGGFWAPPSKLPDGLWVGAGGAGAQAATCTPGPGA